MTSVSTSVTAAIATGEGAAAPHPAGPETVAKLVKIWQELLGQPEVGIQDDFFDLGGDSILGTHLMLAIETQFGLKFELSRLFICPTIELLAKEIVTAQKSNPT